MKTKYLFTFPAALSSQPITYQLVKHYDIKVNILRAEFSLGREGHLLLELESEENNIKRALIFLQDTGVHFQLFEKKILFNEGDCVHCGACTAVCFAGALQIKQPHWKLQFAPEQCIACGWCIKACPLQLFNLNF